MTDRTGRIATDAAPVPAGHHVRATAWRGLVLASGQLGVRPDGRDGVGRPFEAQAAQALADLLAVPGAGGCGPDEVVRVTACIVGASRNSPCRRRRETQAPIMHGRYR